MSFFTHLSQVCTTKNIHLIGTHTLKTQAILLPEESEILAHANLHRQAEFATGRWCARRALAKLGVVKQPILRSEQGAPVWPPQVCGSISHTSGACCAAVAFTLHYRSMGLDIESRTKAISSDAVGLIANADEQEWLKPLADDQRDWARLIFCAKESAFKMFSPLVHRSLPFTVFSLLPPTDEDYFVLVLNEHLNSEFRQGQKFKGCYYRDPEWLLTLCALKSEEK